MYIYIKHYLYMWKHFYFPQFILNPYWITLQSMSKWEFKLKRSLSFFCRRVNDWQACVSSQSCEQWNEISDTGLTSRRSHLFSLYKSIHQGGYGAAGSKSPSIRLMGTADTDYSHNCPRDSVVRWSCEWCFDQCRKRRCHSIPRSVF